MAQFDIVVTGDEKNKAGTRKFVGDSQQNSKWCATCRKILISVGENPLLTSDPPSKQKLQKARRHLALHPPCAAWAITKGLLNKNYLPLIKA